jgi:hypothetical protein
MLLASLPSKNEPDGQHVALSKRSYLKNTILPLMCFHHPKTLFCIPPKTQTRKPHGARPRPGFFGPAYGNDNLQMRTSFPFMPFRRSAKRGSQCSHGCCDRPSSCMNADFRQTSQPVMCIKTAFSLYKASSSHTHFHNTYQNVQGA